MSFNKYNLIALKSSKSAKFIAKLRQKMLKCYKISHKKIFLYTFLYKYVRNC